jgi:hypothetical protein
MARDPICRAAPIGGSLYEMLYLAVGVALPAVARSAGRAGMAR